MFFFSDMRKGAGCNNCSHPTCPNSVNSNGVSNCIECDYGILVLDPSSAPKWKLGCNRCDIIIHLFEDAQKITPLESVCDCGAQLVSVEYRPEKTKFANNVTETKGCIFCTEEFIKLVEKHKAVLSKPKFNRNVRSSGRGRGRPRPKQPKDKMAQLAAYFV